MSNKCPKCGYEYKETDLFCANCGYKFNDEVDANEDIKNSIDEFDTLDGKTIVDKASYKNNILEIVENKNSFSEFLRSSKFNDPVMNIVIFCLIIFIVFSVFLSNSMVKYQKYKNLLYSVNMTSNPAQIPVLKEPKTYNDLAINLLEVDYFIKMYISNSNKLNDKKYLVFSSYLDELDKLPNILNYNYKDVKYLVCKNSSNIKACQQLIQKKFRNIPVTVYHDYASLYLYPDYSVIKANYSKYLPSEFNKYIDFRVKYNKPVSFGLRPYMSPKILANKILDCEKLYNNTTNERIKDKLEKILYNDVKKFIFTPSIYQTTTQEMKKTYKNAYHHFILKGKKSNLRPLIMSYMDKQRGYNDENFLNDYPYNIPKVDDFEDNVNNVTFQDIFEILRKDIYENQNQNLNIQYVYNPISSVWREYNANEKLYKGEYLITEPDENNNVSIYNSNFSLIQDMNIFKYSTMYLISNNLYIYNDNKLSIFKVNFNGRIFSLYNLSISDVTNLFPNVDVINIDSLLNYNVVIEKANNKANYILLSRYSQNWHDYKIQPVYGKIKKLLMPNMFSVDSSKDVVLSFKNIKQKTNQMSEKSPEYKFIIHTIGQPMTNYNSSSMQYDNKTKEDEINNSNNDDYKPNIMPKLQNNENIEIEKIDTKLAPVPTQNIDPPMDNESNEAD